MNEMDDDFYSSGQSPTTPAVVSSPTKDSNIRPHGDMLKMMNPTPNGYSSVPNHKPKSEGQDIVKHHESKNNIDHHKHSSDHVKKKDDDSKHKSSSHSKPKESSKEGKKESHEGHKDKEKHKEGSSHKESSKTKDGSHKHSDSSKQSSEKKEEKYKSESVKKEHHNSDGKPKTDNFKENEKIKDSSSKEHKEKHKEHKEKHKDKHKDKEHKEKHKEHKEKHRDKEHRDEKHKDKEHKEKHKDKSSSDKPKEKSDKPKDKSDKSKDENVEKHKDKERHKDKHSEKHKDKHSEKHKDKHSEKHKEHKEKNKDKIKEESVKKSQSPVKELSPVKVTFKVEPMSPVRVKEEPMSEDDIPLSTRKASLDASKSIKREAEDSEDEPLSMRMEKKIKSEKTKKKKPTSDDEEYGIKEEKPKKKRKVDNDDEEFDARKVKKVKKEKIVKKETKQQPAITTSPKKKKKEEEEQEVWKWWEEEKLEDGIKWKTLEHNGPVFAPPYERVPKNVKFYYDGKHMELSEQTEEVAGFYGRMLDHEYTSKEVFNKNFFKDWKKIMTLGEREIITDLKKCNFNNFNDYYKMKSEERKSMTKEEKLVIKKENEELTKKYGFCNIDNHRQKIGNFKIEPPGLFRGRGEHPKMGMLKRRVESEDIIINCGREAKVPDPPSGHKWKEVRHDNTVSWLASWNENILGSTKYIMLNPSSKLKGEKDWMKYETARKLKKHADRIREEYTRDFKSKEMKVRQRAVALYFIDKLALRAGNEKDEETADTVGCCSLRVEHITLDDEKDGQEYVVSFDFLGKDSIRYENSVAVEKRAYKNLKLFMENKQPGDDLFDRLNTAILNKYLNDLMEGLTAKVFRTYNASKTLQEQLDALTEEDMSIPEKILAYNRANRAVAVLCNHQRAVPKGFSKSMEGLKQKIEEKEKQIRDFKKELKQAKQAAKDGGPKEKQIFEKKKKRLAQLEEQLKKLEVQATDKEENKQIALGTSKLNYLDPRISVAWCKKWGVPIEKVYNKTQRDKFRWAIEMAGPEYKF